MAKKKTTKRSPIQVQAANTTPTGSLYAVPGVTDQNNNLVKHRVRTTGDIMASFLQMWSADQSSDYNRALQQQFIDGVPPFASGNGWGGNGDSASGRINVNWGFGRKMMEQHELPYTDLLDASGPLFSVQTRYGDQSSRNYTEPLLAQGITRTLRNWRPYNYLYQKRAQLFVREGLSFCFYDDDQNWQWKVMGQQDMKFPRESIPCEDMLDCCGCRVDMITSDLAKYIRNEKIAAEEGWNIKAVKDALKASKPRNQYIQNDYQHWQQKWKDNDVIWSTTAPVVETVHYWIKEWEGTVSHYIVRWDGAGEPLYKSEGKYENFSRLLTMFPYGIGTNGDLQSLRGMGAFGYQAGNAMNRVFCAYMEMAMHAGTPHITVTSEDALNDLPLRRMGPYMTVQNGTQFIETKVPPFDQTLIPLFGLTSQIFQNQTQGGGSMLPSQALERKTNLQEQNERAAEGSLTASQMALFFPSEERHLREVVRRMSRESYREDEPGGREVYQLRLWLERNGVPLKALYDIDPESLEINMGLGRGSRMGRLNTVQALMEDYYRYDKKGQNLLLNMKASTLANAQIGNELVPLEEGQRPGEQVQVAILENGNLASKNQAQIVSVVILPDQDHAAHVETHIAFLQQLWPSTQNQNPMEPFETIAPVWEHAIEQWEYMDPESPMYGESKKILRQMGEWVTNTAKQLAAAQQKAELEGQPAQQDAMASVEQNATGMMHALDAEAKMKDVAASRAKLDMDVAREKMKLDFEAQKMALKAQDMRQTMAIRRAERLFDLQSKVEADRLKSQNRKPAA